MFPLEAKVPYDPEPTAWTSYGADNQLDNDVWSRSLTRATVGRLEPAWNVTLDGPVYASPLAFTVGARRLAWIPSPVVLPMT
jgi:hypothetical protein